MAGYEISDFMEFLLTSKFPQFYLLKAQEFCTEAKKRGIHIEESDLEYLDMHEIIRPCLRFHRPILDNEFALFTSFGDPYCWKDLYKQKYVELPKTGDFIPWKKYGYGKKAKIWLYYHPLQLLFLKDQIYGLIDRIKTKEFFNSQAVLHSYVVRKRKEHKEYLKRESNRAKTYHNKTIGLLMLLEEPYSPIVRKLFWKNHDVQKSYSEWNDWYKTKFFLQTIHNKSEFAIGELTNTYDTMVQHANELDPLNKWNTFMLLIRREKKRDLLGKALLAQDFFEASKMLALYIKDLTGKDMLSPECSPPWINNDWRERYYGMPFDISSRKTVEKILSEYIDLRPITTSIIVEGESEEIVIKKILEKVSIRKPESQGIHIYNIRGSGHLSQKNIDGYITRVHLSGNEIYIFIDKDAEKYFQKYLGDILEKKNVVIWNTDFEGDNFGISNVVDYANKLLKEQKKSLITLDEVEEECKKRNLVCAVNTVVYKKTKLKNLISKTELPKQIMKSLFSEINNKSHENNWKPEYPIEKLIDAILRTIPRY